MVERGRGSRGGRERLGAIKGRRGRDLARSRLCDERLGALRREAKERSDLCELRPRFRSFGAPLLVRHSPTVREIEHLG